MGAREPKGTIQAHWDFEPLNDGINHKMLLFRPKIDNTLSYGAILTPK